MFIDILALVVFVYVLNYDPRGFSVLTYNFHCAMIFT